MNPLNSQHQTQAQYFITAGMPALATAGSNSILKPTIATLNTNHHPSSLVNSQQTTNQLLDSNNFMTGASFLPVLLTNQTLLTNAEQQQQQQQKIPPTLINVANSPVVTGANMTTTFLPCSKSQQPLFMASNPGGNITYQVLSSQPSNNLGSSVLTSQNGSVSVLLTSAAPPTMAATSGHVAAAPPPSFIIRNTSTAPAVAVPNVITGTSVDAAATQANRKQQQQYQNQCQQQIIGQALTSQQLNPEILKQIVVGNVKSASNTKAGQKPLLKSSILSTKTLTTTGGGVQQSNSTSNVTVNKPIALPQQQKQTSQKFNLQQAMSGKIITAEDTTKICSNSVTSECHKTVATQSFNNNNNNVIIHSVQKLPQVSLLQNPKNKSLVNTTSCNVTPQVQHSTTTSAPTTVKSLSLVHNVESNISKKTKEIRVDNLNHEVSLIKKSTSIGDNISKEPLPAMISLLKSNTLPEKQEKGEISLLKTTKTNPFETVEHTMESKSLLKANVSDKIFVNAINVNSSHFETEDLESLLKANKLPANKLSSTNLSPRRTKSFNSILKVTQEDSIDSNDNTNRRHSEPNEEKTAELTKKVNDPILETVKPFKSKEIVEKSLNRFHNLDVDSLNSQELDTLLDVFEDEEYLESSGERAENNSKDARSEPQSLSSPVAPHNSEDIMELDEVKQKCINSEVDVDNSKKTIAPQTEDISKKIINESESDDDVTILPIDDTPIEPIEIDDDDDEDVIERKDLPIATMETPSVSHHKEPQNDLLLCDEQILISSSSSMSNHSSDQISMSSTQKSPKLKANTASASPLLMKSLTERKFVKDEPLNGCATVLDMLSNYNMLNWRERIGTARGTQLKFQLNEFNLIQVHEKVPNRTKSSYERPVFERDNLQIKKESNAPTVYYMCRRCNVRAAAIDFLAPEFCSLYCLRRNRRKRQQGEERNPCILRKKHRNILAINTSSNPPPLTYISQPKFRWSSYLKANFKTIAAPISLFLNPIPTGPNNFQVGMKLEAIDPENCSLFCVCTVVEINGYRLKLSFDGYDNSYDFWLNADSMDIFPPGWCSKTNRILQPPKGLIGGKFNWGSYLNKEKAVPAPRHLFTHLNSSSLIPRNNFKIGMYLEAEDLNDTGKLCVSSIADVLDDRIRIHFDGWDDCYDIIVDINSPYIHPCGWHNERQQLVVPPDCDNVTFNWNQYIRKQGTGVAAGEELFLPREPINFRPNMKLEVVDPRNSSLIRPATVVSHKGHRVKLHLDGWPNDYCFWLEDDSPDLHPIGWCDATGHELEPPPGFHMDKQKMPCPISGCRGIGNAKKMYMNVHASRDCCPYAPENWLIVMEKPPRLGYDDITRTLPRQSKQQITHQQQNALRLSNQEILEHLEILDSIKTRNMLMQQNKTATSTKDLIGFSSLTRDKKENNKFDATALSASSNSSNASLSCKSEEKDDTPMDVNIEIAKEFLCDYGPRLQQSYTLWQNNCSFEKEAINNNPLEWTVSEVVEFVGETIKNLKMAEMFVQEDINGESFLMLQQEDMTERLGLKLGPAIKLYTCILQLRTLAVTKFNVPYGKASKN